MYIILYICNNIYIYHNMYVCLSVCLCVCVCVCVCVCIYIIIYIVILNVMEIIHINTNDYEGTCNVGDVLHCMDKVEVNYTNREV